MSNEWELAARYQRWDELALEIMSAGIRAVIVTTLESVPLQVLSLGIMPGIVVTVVLRNLWVKKPRMPLDFTTCVEIFINGVSTGILDLVVPSG